MKPDEIKKARKSFDKIAADKQAGCIIVVERNNVGNEISLTGTVYWHQMNEQQIIQVLRKASGLADKDLVMGILALKLID